MFLSNKLPCRLVWDYFEFALVARVARTRIEVSTNGIDGSRGCGVNAGNPEAVWPTGSPRVNANRSVYPGRHGRTIREIELWETILSFLLRASSSKCHRSTVSCYSSQFAAISRAITRSANNWNNFLGDYRFFSSRSVSFRLGPPRPVPRCTTWRVCVRRSGKRIDEITEGEVRKTGRRNKSTPDEPALSTSPSKQEVSSSTCLDYYITGNKV